MQLLVETDIESGGELLAPGVLREHRQAAPQGPVRERRDACLLQHPQAVELADRLDDPG
jgi:hypothetical protein